MSSSVHRRVLVLQHPREPHEVLGTVPILTEVVPDAVVRVGLSWRSLRHALGDDSAEPRRWVVLYLGTGLPPETKALLKPRAGETAVPRLFELRRDKSAVALDSGSDPVDGVVVLDGTWPQVKTLWWRNAWLTRLRRGVCAPVRRSRYGALRREPRPECLSTVESLGLALTALGEDPDVEARLTEGLERMVASRRAPAAT